MTALMSLRIDETLKEKFIEAAKSNRQSLSEAMREAVTFYIHRTRNQQMAAAAARIRANVEEEEDVMRWIAHHAVTFDDEN